MEMQEENEKNGSWDSFLTDKENLEDGVSYINPNIETKLPANKRNECREIIREIKNFGINQRQILYLIYLLSLELENQEIMKSLVKVIGSSREKVPVSNLVLSQDDF
jgi:hypothetical protein